MLIFEVTGFNAGGMPFKYRVREADVVPTIGRFTRLIDLATALDVIYDFEQEVGFPDISNLSINVLYEELPE